MNSEVDLTPGRHKRLKTCTDGKYHDIRMDFSASKSDEITLKKPICSPSSTVDFSSPLSILDGLESGKFGSVAKDIQALLVRKMQSPNLYSKSFPSPKNGFLDLGKDQVKPASKFMNQKTTRSEVDTVVIDLEDESATNEPQTTSVPVMVIDSDGEDMGDQTSEKPPFTSRNVLTEHPSGETFLKGVKEDKYIHMGIKDERNNLHDTEDGDSGDACVVDFTQIKEDESVYGEPAREILFKDVKEDKRVNVENEDEDNQLPNTADGGFEDPCLKDLTEIKEGEPVYDQPAGETLLKDTEEDKDGHVGVEDEGNRLPNTENGDLGDVCVEGDTEIKEDGFWYGQPSGETLLKDVEEDEHVHVGIQDEGNHLSNSGDGDLKDVCGEDATEIKQDECVYVGTEDEGKGSSSVDDGLEDCWREMSMALEFSKDVSVPTGNKQAVEESEDEDKCPHSFILKDDLGYVCRICGVIDKGIETIFEFQYNKVKRSNRTYMRGLWNSKDGESTGIGALNLAGDNLTLNEVYAHPRHANKMKPHQVEGFNFLVSNLVGDNPGGCILAHAPGSGKTFMVISFLQSFMAKYPNARPLVVLPKGILDTWKKEFRIWQVEDIPLYDLHSIDNQFQQLAVLKQWVESRSILFLGYQKFSSIVCDRESSKVTNSCREILLKTPSILFLDEGHTPRNDGTDIFQTLAMVQTPRKVVLSGTLYQNRVKEVFTLLNLVRPNFLKTETSQPIVKRIMSKVDVSLSTVRKNFKASSDVGFYDMVEDTLQKDKDFKRKMSVINDLREMTSKVLQYYKGDFLHELPGLLDFTVVLHLSPSQKHEVEKIKLQNKLKAISVGGSVYLHPKLQPFSDNRSATDDINEVLENLVVEDGVKAKFFCNVLNLCESKDEKLLVFSQYITPLKFLERLLVKQKGWCRGREIFFVSGDSRPNDRKLSMECFNSSPKARVFFGSIKACGEGISLVGASRIIILDVHLNPSVTRQAIGRAFRPGQTKKVVVYRLVAADSPEVEDYETCFRKELISKLWFEWKEYCRYRDFEVETVDVNECGDEFLESNPILAKDVKVLYRR